MSSCSFYGFLSKHEKYFKLGKDFAHLKNGKFHYFCLLVFCFNAARQVHFVWVTKMRLNYEDIFQNIK